MSSNGWHIDTPKGCGKREREKRHRLKLQDRAPKAQTDGDSERKRQVLETDREDEQESV